MNIGNKVRLREPAEQAMDFIIPAGEENADINSIFDSAIEGLKEYHPELHNPKVVEEIRSLVEVNNTGNNQRDYEETRNQVEKHLGQLR
jgi:hypothetical protein